MGGTTGLVYENPRLLASYHDDSLAFLDMCIAFREAQARERGREVFRPTVEELRSMRAAKLLGLFFSSASYS